MPSVLAHIPANLRTFIEPQIEQLKADVAPGRFGYDCSFSSRSPIASGYIWAASLGNDCLVTAHAIVPHEDFRLVECPSEYGCLCALSGASLSQTPIESSGPVQPDENFVAFFQAAGEFPSLLEKGRSYTSQAICLTPSFFKRLKSRYPGDFDTLSEDIATLKVNEFPEELRTLVRQIGPQRAGHPGAELYFRAKVFEAASLVTAHIAETRQARLNRGSATQASLAAQARAFIDAHLGEPLSIAKVAAACYVGRSRLCAAFCEETGVPIAAYIRRHRMNRACELLSATTLDIAQVGRTVGYPNPGSFSEAFRRELGTSPSAWREGARDEEVDSNPSSPDTACA